MHFRQVHCAFFPARFHMGVSSHPADAQATRLMSTSVTLRMQLDPKNHLSAKMTVDIPLQQFYSLGLWSSCFWDL